MISKRVARSLIAITAILTTGQAGAEVSGPYITGMGVVHQVRDSDTEINGVVGNFESGIGFGAGMAVGYQFANGIRVEGEAVYRRSEVTRASGVPRSDNVNVWSGMANVLWEYDNPSGVYPYFGGGLGLAHIDAKEPLQTGGLTAVDNDVTLAAQGIAGLGFALTPNLTGIVEYRYLHAFNPSFSTSTGNFEADYRTHSAMVGVRYRFGAAPARRQRAVRRPVSVQPSAAAVQPTTVAPAVIRPVEQAKAAASLRRTYVVFFATDSSVLSEDARAIVREATDRAIKDQTREIDLTGHADRVGAAAYNQALSVRRAEAAAAMLRSGGVSARLRIFGKGETDPLVPTADNVAEPRNRRVEIVLRGTDDGLKVSRN